MNIFDLDLRIFGAEKLFDVMVSSFEIYIAEVDFHFFMAVIKIKSFE
jgi:hypothetical protein